MDHITEIRNNFQTFYREWVTRLEQFSQELLHHLAFIEDQDEAKLQQLVHAVLTHYQQYCIRKEQLLSHDVFLVLSPTWLTSYERTFLWLAGFRPSFTIHVVRKCAIDFSTDQAERFERVVEEIKSEEKDITERLARLEQQMVSPRMLALAGIGGMEMQNGLMNEVDAVMDQMAEEMEVLVRCADCLREKLVGKVVEILTPAQNVKFLAGNILVQLRIRRWGLVWESEVVHGDDTNHG